MNRHQRRAASEDIASRVNTGLAFHQAGRLDDAERMYQQVLELDPRQADALHLLGVVAEQRGRPDEAAALIRKAIAVNGKVATFHSNLGNALHSCGRLDEAAAAYRKALALRPDYAEAHSNLGITLKDSGRPQDAAAAFRKALALQPERVEIHVNLATALLDMGQPEEAEAACRQALALRPDNANAWTNLGNALQAQGKWAESGEPYRNALNLRPDHAETWSNLAHSLHEMAFLPEAETICRQALALLPDNAAFWSNLGNILLDMGRANDAAEAQRTALKHRPDYAEAWSNLGVALKDLGRLDEAEDAIRTAIRLSPDYAAAHCNLAMALMLTGRFSEGWEEYEWRWRGEGATSREWRNFPQPQWSGEAGAGRTILLWAEQGLGDTIQFVRYLPAVLERGWRVVLEVPGSLLGLLGSTAGVTLVAKDQPLPPFEVHCPLLSLPRIFGTTLGTIPQAVPYLHAAPERVAHWAARLPRTPERPLAVGLVWAGNPRQANLAAHRIDRRRSIRLADLAPLAEVGNVRFVSLQKDAPAALEAAAPPAGMDLVDPMPEVADFADTAAIVANLDLVISVDTSVAHLAGALGKPVWILSRFDGCWRWLLDREDSPWYPGARIFRQPRPGDWTTVIGRVRDELAALKPRGNG